MNAHRTIEPRTLAVNDPDNVCRHILQELALQVRSFTIQLFDAFPDQLLTQAPLPTRNHALWHAGHTVWLQDTLLITPLTGTTELSDDWRRHYGQYGQPKLPSDLPAERAKVKSALESQKHRILEVLCSAKFDPAEHDYPQVGLGRSLVGGIIHGLHDEARHHGEMYLLLKWFRRD